MPVRDRLPQQVHMISKKLQRDIQIYADPEKLGKPAEKKKDRKQQKYIEKRIDFRRKRRGEKQFN